MQTKSHWLLVLVFFVACLSLLEAQTSKKQPRRSSKKATSTISKQKADGIAAAKADSLKNTLRAQAVADSLKRVEGTKNDSTKSIKLRKIENTAFGVGERLVFNVSYGPINAGEAVMAVPRYETIAGRNTYRVEFTVTSHPSFDWIYQVRDQYLTFVDVETIAPLRFEQHIREGTYKRDFTADFDQVKHIARTSEGNYPIPEYVHDIMSAFYYARTLDYTGMKVGDYITLFNFYKDKSYELRVKFLGRQELEVEAGTFNTLVVEPLVKEGGLFKAEGRIVIWLTDDERKIPIRVNTKVVVGSIDTELKEYSGLVGPVRSRIK